MDDYDVIIVGARPAGAATALNLARRGHRVLVLERARAGRDTLSTHALMRAGVLQLERWGLLDRVIAADTPPIFRVTFGYSDDDAVPIDLEVPLYAPRRTVLDPIIADAAAEAGACIRYGTAVVGVISDRDGRVRGVRVRERDGSQLDVHAALTVGADGTSSTVARHVDPAVTHAGRSASALIYAYFTGVPTDGLQWLYEVGASAGLIPTNDGQVCAFVATGSHRFMRDMRGDLRGAFDALLDEVSPRTARLLAAGQRVSPFRGAPSPPGWLRRAHGEGWALVGDAGYFKDPQSAHGLSDALRDADLLARAVADGLSGRMPMRRALAGYEAMRDELSMPLFDAVEAVAAYDWSLDEVREHHLAMSAAMRHEVRHLDNLDAVAAA